FLLDALPDINTTRPSSCERVIRDNGGTGGSQTTSSEPTSPFETEDGGPVPVPAVDDHTSSSVDSTLSPSATVPAALPYIYGHVFFQHPDPSIRRGYFQKSFVLISHLPLLGLWSRVVEIVGQSMFRALRKAPSTNGQQGVAPSSRPAYTRIHVRSFSCRKDLSFQGLRSTMLFYGR
ncbi:hypothetical protein A4X09_0g7509, partial [Tilletia walkeri]